MNILDSLQSLTVKLAADEDDFKNILEMNDVLKSLMKTLETHKDKTETKAIYALINKELTKVEAKRNKLVEKVKGGKPSSEFKFFLDEFVKLVKSQARGLTISVDTKRDYIEHKWGGFGSSEGATVEIKSGDKSVCYEFIYRAFHRSISSNGGKPELKKEMNFSSFYQDNGTKLTIDLHKEHEDFQYNYVPPASKFEEKLTGVLFNLGMKKPKNKTDELYRDLHSIFGKVNNEGEDKFFVTLHASEDIPSLRKENLHVSDSKIKSIENDLKRIVEIAKNHDAVVSGNIDFEEQDYYDGCGTYDTPAFYIRENKITVSGNDHHTTPKGWSYNLSLKIVFTKGKRKWDVNELKAIVEKVNSLKRDLSKL